MDNIFHVEFGYLIKDTKTGEIDAESGWPCTEAHTKNRPLVDGYEWVKVKVTYTEVR